MKYSVTLITLIAFTAVVLLTGCSKSPGEKLIGHFDGLAEAAGEHKDDCDKMGESMEKYLKDNEKDLEETIKKLKDDKQTEDANKKLEKDMEAVMEKLEKNTEKCKDNEKVMGSILVIPFMMAAAMEK